MLNRILKTAVPAAALILTTAVQGDVVVLEASKDNSMYQGFFSDTNASGAGPNLFVGNIANGQGFSRRSLIEFDVSGIPACSTINSVTLSLVLDMSISNDQDIATHRVLQEWGEGTSVPDGGGGGGGGAGGEPTEDSSTWEHTFFPDELWDNPGGDFDGTASAVTSVGGATTAYLWSSAGMVDDVQGWVGASSSNHGWILIGNEIDIVTTKRFVSSEGDSAEDRPTLTIDFTPPTPCPSRGDFDGNGSIGFADLSSLLNAWGPCPGCPEDLSGDGSVGFADLSTLLNNWGCCPAK